MATIDPNRKSHYTLHLADDILSSDAVTESLLAIRLNHKPTQDGRRRTALTKNRHNNYSLDITDSEGGNKRSYRFEGERRDPKKSYVVAFDPVSQSCTLQPLASSYSFNFRSAPWESSSSKLEEQYAQIHENSEPSSEDEASDPFGSASDGEAEQDNPFDYRHYLSSSRRKPMSPVSSRTSTAKAALKSESATRERAASNPEGKSATHRPDTKRAPAPKILMDRRDSTRDNDGNIALPKKAQSSEKHMHKQLALPTHESSTAAISQETKSSKLSDNEDEFDDDFSFGNNGGTGGLEIDFGDDPPPPTKRQRALTLPGSSHGGPISLRSAANSPSSQVQTPRLGRTEPEDFVLDLGSMQEEDEEEDADVSEVDHSPETQRKTKRNQYDESDGDGDVEPMSLGSPAHITADVSASDVESLVDPDLEAQVLRSLTEADDIQQGMDSEESEAE